MEKTLDMFLTGNLPPKDSGFIVEVTDKSGASEVMIDTSSKSVGQAAQR